MTVVLGSCSFGKLGSLFGFTAWSGTSEGSMGVNNETEVSSYEYLEGLSSDLV